MTLAEALETTRIHSVAGLTGDRTALVTTCPCRAPHHPISDVGLIGGGHVPMPGEVSLAHHGVRFLDERPGFRRHVLEVLRQPREKSVICIQSRVPPRPDSSDHLGSSVPVKSSLRAAQTCGISRHLRTLLLARSLVEAEYAAAEANFASIIIMNCGGEVPMTLPSSVSSLPAARI
jgi:Magnesium chelatase, subunit ChlI